MKNTWLVEVASIMTSCVSFAAIVSVLHHFNQTPVFDWHSISLNTLVSVLSTVTKTLLLLAVTACLSQWNFIWFSQSRRPLIHFDVFDSASRGPQGSLSLLWHIKWRYDGLA